MNKALEFLNRFLHLCEETSNKHKSIEANKQLQEAHKQLADAHSKNGNIPTAIKHLESLFSIANENQDNRA